METPVVDASRSMTLRIAMAKVLCAMAAQFAVIDLSTEAIDFEGHHLLPTALRIRTNRGRQRIYYCKCGLMAVTDSNGATFKKLGASPSHSC